MLCQHLTYFLILIFKENLIVYSSNWVSIGSISFTYDLSITGLTWEEAKSALHFICYLTQ